MRHSCCIMAGKVFVGSLILLAVISTAAFVKASQNQEQQAEDAAHQLSVDIAQATAKFCLDLYKVSHVSVRARTAINVWVDEITKQKITDLIAPGILNKLTRLVMVNAIYFKGNWEVPFQKGKTSDQPFYTPAALTAVQVPMMRREGDFRLGYLKDVQTRVLEIPYTDPRLSMLIFLPDEVEGIKLLGKKVQDLPLWVMDSFLHTTKINVVLPKFKVKLSVSLNDHLKNLGITDLFDEEIADLSGITGRKNLFVSKIIHKAFIEVNAEGSEAAAATAAVAASRRSGPRSDAPIPFVADHPFLFMICDSKTSSARFVGRLSLPH